MHALMRYCMIIKWKLIKFRRNETFLFEIDIAVSMKKKKEIQLIELSQPTTVLWLLKEIWNLYNRLLLMTINITNEGKLKGGRDGLHQKCFWSLHWNYKAFEWIAKLEFRYRTGDIHLSCLQCPFLLSSY